MIVAVGFGTLAAAGTLARVVLSHAAGRAVWSTLLANVGASFALGLAGGASSTMVTLVGTALCGSLSTLSTLALEVVDSADRRAGAGYLAATLILGVGAAAAGLALSS